MKIIIGKYKRYYNVYNIQYFFERKGYDFSWFFDSKFCEFIDGICDKIYRFRTRKSYRKEKIIVHEYDVIDCDKTLALVIAPVLKQFKSGCNWPVFDVEYSAEQTQEIIDKMIFAFESIAKDDDFERFFYFDVKENETKLNRKRHEEHKERIKEGLELFAKYFQHLW
jgi:hypothetical protein